MDPNSSLGKICLGENIIAISSDKIEGSGDRDSLKYQDTVNSRGKKESKAIVFHKMDTEEVSDIFMSPCFVNGLEVHDGEINIGIEEIMISNENAMKLCLDHEVKKGDKVVKKELIIALRGEIYFVKLIINPDEDDFEPGLEPFLDDSEEEEKGSVKDLDDLFDFDFDDIPLLLGEEPQQFICKMGKSGRNKKKVMEKLDYFYQNIRPSSSTGRHMTHEEAEKEALVISISQRYALLDEIIMLVIETLAYHDKYKKLIDEIWADKVKLEGKVKKKEEEAIMEVKGKTLEEGKDPEAFIFPIRLEGKINENALADTGSDINMMPYRIYEGLGRDDIKKVNRGIIMVNYTEAEAMGVLLNVLCHIGFTTLTAKFLVLDIPIDRDASIVVGQGFLKTLEGTIDTTNRVFSIFDGACHQTFRAAKTEVLRITESDSDDEEKLWEEMMMKPNHQETNVLDNTKPWKRSCFHKFIMISCYRKVATKRQSLELCHEFYSTYEFDKVCADDELQSKKIIKFRLGGRTHILTLLEFARRLGLYQAAELDEEGFDVYFQGDLDTTTLKELIDSEGSLIPEVPHPGAPRVGIPRPPRASMQDLYDRMGRIKIRHEAIERIEYRQSYHWDMYARVFDHMAGMYNVPMKEKLKERDEIEAIRRFKKSIERV
ncbi:retrotransposon ORF1 [Tanacetum coccineum]